MTEIELKLTVTPEDLAKLRKSKVVASLSVSRAITRRNYSVYYDTDKFQLRDHRLALRLRKNDGRWTQTVKLVGSSVGGLAFRPEYEASTPAQLLNWSALEQTPAAEVLAKAQTRHELRPVFLTDFRRTARRLRMGEDTTAEIAFDSGVIRVGDTEAPLCEVELELKSGHAEQLFDIAKQLVGIAPSARIEVRSKAERGYALAEHIAPAPLKARASSTSAEQSVIDSFSAIAAACLHHFQANREGVTYRDDTEYVHQARVAIRRLRSCFAVFRDLVPKSDAEALLAQWRELATRLGAVRDLDVITQTTLPAIQDDIGTGADLRPLIARFELERETARRTLQAQLRTPAQIDLELELGAALITQPWREHWSDERRDVAAMPLEDFARHVLNRQFKRVRRRATALGSNEAAPVHAFRIQMKKLRYAMEFFSPLFATKEMELFLGRTAELQDILGQLNDDAVLLARLEAIDSIESTALLGTIAFLRGFVQGRRSRTDNRLIKSWQRLETSDQFWRTRRKSRH